MDSLDAEDELASAGAGTKDFNSESDDLFEHWAENEADVFGRLAWPDMQRQIFSEML